MTEKSKNVEIYEILQCPICHEIAGEIPIYQCSKGHLLCHECVDKVTKCPICRETMPANKIRNLGVEQLAQTIKIACKHNKNGCNAKFKILDYRHHLTKNCDFEEFGYCHQMGADCDEIVTWRDFSDHVIKDHMNTSFPMDFKATTKAHGDVFKGTINQEIRIVDLDKNLVVWKPIFLKHDSNIFAILTRYNGKEKTIHWVTVVHQLEKKDYQSEITLISVLDGRETKSTGLVQSLRNIRPGFDELNGAALPLKAAQDSLVHNESTDTILKWTIGITIGTRLIDSVGSPSKIPSVSSISYQILDNEKSTDVNAPLHERVSCDSCGMRPIMGMRYKCAECPDYDLCEGCEKTGLHNHHILLRIPTPSIKEKAYQFFKLVQYSVDRLSEKFRARQSIQ